MERAIQAFQTWAIVNDAPTRDQEQVDVEDDEDDAASNVATRPTGRRMKYSNDFKLKVAMEAAKATDITSVAVRHGVRSRPSVYSWLCKIDALRVACSDNKRSKVCLGGQGRPPIFPFGDKVLQWVREMRREDFPLKTSHVLHYVREEYSHWTTSYLQDKKEDSLYRLLQRLIHRHGSRSRSRQEAC